MNQAELPSRSKSICGHPRSATHGSGFTGTLEASTRKHFFVAAKLLSKRILRIKLIFPGSSRPVDYRRPFFDFVLKERSALPYYSL